MSWKQKLVEAQVSVNRAVFEMNKPGRLKPEAIRSEYITECIEDAIKELIDSLDLLKSEVNDR